jgi:hypothetical protein
MWIRKKSYEHLMSVLNEYQEERTEFLRLFGNPTPDFKGTFVEWVQHCVGLKDQRIKELMEHLLNLIDKMNRRIDEASADPNIKKIRILLPEELQSLVVAALSQLGSSEGHSECSKTLLAVVRTFAEKETIS